MIHNSTHWSYVNTWTSYYTGVLLREFVGGISISSYQIPQLRQKGIYPRKSIHFFVSTKYTCTTKVGGQRMWNTHFILYNINLDNTDILCKNFLRFLYVWNYVIVYALRNPYGKPQRQISASFHMVSVLQKLAFSSTVLRSENPSINEIH